MRVAVAAVGLAGAWILLALRVDPVPTWFYVFAWYPTLVLLDAVGSRPVGAASPLGRPGRVASLLAWSAPIWLLFEAANLRIENWYYVFLPAHPVERWAGILLSFATVVPAVLLAERALRSAGVGRAWQTRPIRLGQPWELGAAVALGAAGGALALLFPQRFFPLVWGAAWLIADPLVYHRRPEWSLLADLTRGEWGRIGRLLLGGLGIGLLWELYNAWARGKWIYTVPWLEEIKLFEMPPLGFVGFPFFALEAWALYHALCVLRVALPLEGERGPENRAGDRVADAQPANSADRRFGGSAVRGSAVRGSGVGSAARAALAGGLAAAFSVMTLLAMERRTISSTVPRLEQLPGISAGPVAALRRAGVDSPFELARADPAGLAEAAALDAGVADSLVETARLVTLRGIGTAHAARLRAVGVGTVAQLAARHSEELWLALRQDGNASYRPTAAEVRVWVGRAECRMLNAEC